MTKKRKLSTTDLIIIILIISIIILGIKEVYEKIQYEKTATVVGEIVYSQSLGKDVLWDRETQKFYIQILPLGQEDGTLYLYTFTKNSTGEGEFSIWLDEMPELQVGNIVEIEYRIQDVKYLDGKEIISIKRIEPTEDMSFNMPLVPNENYFLNIKTAGMLKLGNVYHLSRVEEMRGYMLYLEYGDRSPLSAYWIDDEVIEGETDDIKEAFRTGVFNERVRVQIANALYSEFKQELPFVDYDCDVINDIEFYP